MDYADEKDINCTIDNATINELWWHKQGLQQTASGYGKKLTTKYIVNFCGKKHRVYAICFSNVACHYILCAGKPLYLREKHLVDL
jgi:hypothetical protein